MNEAIQTWRLATRTRLIRRGDTRPMEDDATWRDLAEYVDVQRGLPEELKALAHDRLGLLVQRQSGQRVDLSLRWTVGESYSCLGIKLRVFIAGYYADAVTVSRTVDSSTNITPRLYAEVIRLLLDHAAHGVCQVISRGPEHPTPFLGESLQLVSRQEGPDGVSSYLSLLQALPIQGPQLAGLRSTFDMSELGDFVLEGSPAADGWGWEWCACVEDRGPWIAALKQAGYTVVPFAGKITRTGYPTAKRRTRRLRNGFSREVATEKSLPVTWRSGPHRIVVDWVYWPVRDLEAERQEYRDREDEITAYQYHKHCKQEVPEGFRFTFWPTHG